MGYALIVKPLALLALGFVIWVLWRAGDHLAPGAVAGHRVMVGAGGAVIAAMVLGPPAWAALRDSPGEVLGWAAGLVFVGTVGWGYARLVAAARRRAEGRHRRED